MATKFSQIAAAGANPAGTDQLVGVTGGTTDNLFTITQTIQGALDSIGATRGEVLFRGSGGWTVLGTGTSGQFLKTQGVGNDVAWASVSGSGLIVGGSAISGGTTGGVLWDNGGTLEESSNFTWVNASQKLLIASGTIDTKNGAGVIITAPTTGGGSGNALMGSASPISGYSGQAVVSDGSGNFGFVSDSSNGNVWCGQSSGNYGTSTGVNNVGMGKNSLNSLTSGGSNMAIGTNSLTNCQNGSQNVGVGISSLNKITTTGDNIGIGYSSMSNVVTGTRNVAIGSLALTGLTTNDGNNIGIGYSCAGAAAGSNGCIFIGTFTGYNSAAGTANTYIGYQAANNVTGGSYNTFLGGWPGPSSSISNAIALSDGQGNLRLDYNSTASNAWTMTSLGGAGLVVGNSSGTLSAVHSVTSASTPANFSAAVYLMVNIGGTTYYIPADTATW